MKRVANPTPRMTGILLNLKIDSFEKEMDNLG